MNFIVPNWLRKEAKIVSNPTKFDNMTTGNIQACLKIFPRPSPHLDENDFEYMYTLWQDLQFTINTHQYDKLALLGAIQSIVNVCNDSCTHLNGIWLTLRENQPSTYELLKNLGVQFFDFECIITTTSESISEVIPNDRLKTAGL